MIAVFDRSQATLGTRLVLLALANYAHPDGSNAFPMVETIAQRAHVSERTARAALGELERLGEISRVGRTKRGVTIWHLDIVGPRPADSAPDFLGDGSSTGSGADPAPQAAAASPLACRSCPTTFRSEAKRAEHEYVVHDGPQPAHYHEEETSP